MRRRGRRHVARSGVALLLAALCCATGAWSSRLEQVSDHVWVVRDDDGNWGGPTMGITHQSDPGYWARKVLDLSELPPAVWEAVRDVRLSIHFCVRDYSWHDLPQANGLDETFEIVVNGEATRYPTSTTGLPVFREQRPVGDSMRWWDVSLRKGCLIRGPNEFVFRKIVTQGKRPDDYFYLGIDTTVEGGRSWVRFGADQPWRSDKLTVPGGTGEYMVRLYLLCGDTELNAAWYPQDDRLDDPQGVVSYAGSHGATTRIEWNPLRLDALSPISVIVETISDAAYEFRWLGEDGDPRPAVEAKGPRYEARLESGLPFRPSGIELGKDIPVKRIAVRASPDYHPLSHRVDMTPHIAAPRGALSARKPRCAASLSRAALANRNLRCAFTVEKGRLKLASLYNELAASQMVSDAEECALFLIEVEGERYAGSRDFACESLTPSRDGPGFTAVLFNAATGLEGKLTVSVDDRDLFVELVVTNRADAPRDFKVAFPHLSGLAISDAAENDYYFFPWGGGIFSDAPAVIRRGYGDHEALYQLMDIYSPERGAGLSIRCTDVDGRHKVLALRKHIPGRAELNGDAAYTPTGDEYKWTNCLPATPGVGVAFEYLRRTRGPGESFAPKSVALRAHPKDWHVAMKDYADWCHRVWRFRPRPSRLTPIVNMLAAGWGKSPLFRDGAYRTDFIEPRCDCIELMSWWEWSPLGPWRTPWDKLEERIGPAMYKRYSAYWVPDPVTGKTMYPLNRGDYDGYNERWGGLPALRAAINTYRDMGALVTLYTDPILADDNTKCGRQWGELWGIVKPDGTYRTSYESWNMCHDVAGYREYVADTMRRVMQETDADGIRLDEYGHCGAACFNTKHAHTFAEWGCTEWQRAIAETTETVREAMDDVKPGSVLTTEHPGCDYLMQFIEGCITYDLTVQATPLRPLECNLQRFYFPECKAYELDHRSADPTHRKRFWNGVGSFGSYYPEHLDAILREHADAFQGNDCEPLVPTLARHVYANRFSAAGKTIYTLYNATGHTFYGPVLRIPCAEDEHIIDLLNGTEADWSPEDGHAVIRAFLARDDVAAVARVRRAPGREPRGNT